MKKLILLLFLIIPVVIFAQEYASITGKMVDATTGKPLPFASVSLKGSSISNISNADGVFSLKLPIDYKDSVILSFIGYDNLILPIDIFNTSKLYTAKLNPSLLSIKSITVRPSDALSLFNQVFSSQNIKNNYSTNREGLLGFYREIIKRGNKYLTLNEAIIDINKSPYNSFASDIMGIYKGRGNQNIRNEDTLFIKFQGGPLTMMEMDIAKNSFIGCDMLNAPVIYDFTLESNVYRDGENIYVIGFNQKDSVSDILFRGKLFISSESLALIRAEFSMNVENNPKAWKEFIKKKPDKCDITVNKAEYVINYKKFGGKYFYDNARLELVFSAKYKGRILKNKYSIISELAITDVNNKLALSTDANRKIRYKDIMASKVQDFRDDNFWGNYNIIEPDNSIENIINKIIKQLKRDSK